MVLAKYLIFFGVCMVLSPLANYIFYLLFKHTSSPIPFVGSIFIFIGNLLLAFGEQYSWIYSLSLLIIPFDCGIRFLLKKSKP